MEELTGYHGSALERLKKYSISIGDQVSINVTGKEYSGSLLPRYEHSDDKHIVVKLSSGYNIGIAISKIISISKIADGSKPRFKPPPIPEIDPSLPKVSILGTGGTIASRIDYKTGAVHPAFSAEEIYSIIPDLSRYAEIEADVVFNLASENMRSQEWSKLAESIFEKIRSGVAGVVIGHGTDTMAYTSAALSFALMGTPVPIILVGSQRSTDRPSSDAALNMRAAVILASKAEFTGVYLVMHSSMNDDSVSIHSGTKVRKNHTSRRDAFESINASPVGYVRGENIELSSNLPQRGTSKGFAPKTNFEEKVTLLKFNPGFDPTLIDTLREKGYRGLVLEGTGLGHVSSLCYQPIKKAITDGMMIGMSSQCVWGRVRMTVYSTGRELLNLGVIPLDNMLSEVALAKMMWVLGNYHDQNEAKKMMTTNLAGEIQERSLIERGSPEIRE